MIKKHKNKNLSKTIKKFLANNINDEFIQVLSLKSF